MPDGPFEDRFDELDCCSWHVTKTSGDPNMFLVHTDILVSVDIWDHHDHHRPSISEVQTHPDSAHFNQMIYRFAS